MPASSALEGRPGVGVGGAGSATGAGAGAWAGVPSPAGGAGSPSGTAGAGPGPASWPRQVAAVQTRRRRAMPARVIVADDEQKKGVMRDPRVVGLLAPALPLPSPNLNARGERGARTHTHTPHPPTRARAGAPPSCSPSLPPPGGMTDSRDSDGRAPLPAVAGAGAVPSPSKPAPHTGAAGPAHPAPGLRARLLASWQATQRKRISAAGEGSPGEGRKRMPMLFFFSLLPRQCSSFLPSPLFQTCWTLPAS